MFTEQTLSAVSSLLDLYYKSRDLVSQTSEPHFTASRDILLHRSNAHQLKTVALTFEMVARGSLLEGLRTAEPDFVGTPFEAAIRDVIEAFDSGTADGDLSASVALSTMRRKAGDWLKAQAEAALPLRQYSVGSAFGRLTVQATSPQNARVVAAAQHFSCSVAELSGDELRGFANGVLVA